MTQTARMDLVVEYCLEKLADGASIEDCMRHFPDVDPERLRRLLETSQRVRQFVLSSSELTSAQETVWQQIAEPLVQQLEVNHGLRLKPLILATIAISAITTLAWYNFI
ncbi:MAG: hypothetical protein IPK19_25790 [Chloroflexi bacterium]|nr:hypothetical protein [Chloroflexota bacterium]